MDRDAVAEALERKGLWRRAATQWLDVMLKCKDENMQERLRCRLNRCLDRAKHAPPRRVTLHDLNRAATRVLRASSCLYESQKTVTADKDLTCINVAAGERNVADSKNIPQNGEKS